MGGIEVTLLGSNFSREALVNCAIGFGQNVVLFAGANASTTLSAGQASSSTGNGLGVGAQVYNDNVIICMLPPSPVAGPVEVKFFGLPAPMPGLGLPMGEPPAPIFTYIEEEEKDLMIHALQILGWQNSGQWQDAKSVAMNILGNQNQAMGGMMGMEDSSNADLSSLIGGLGFSATQGKTANKGGLARQATQSNINQIELGVWNVLRRAQHPATGVISHISTPHPVTGRTLLHIASALGFSKLVAALIGWKANVDIADKNGFSPVHFACFYGRTECVDILVRIGRAHLEGRDLQGRTPFDVCGTEQVRDFVLELEEEVETRRRKSTAPSEIESGGEGDDEKYTTSEADFEEEEEEEDSFQQPEPVGEPSRSASRRVSRANSLASIASNRKAARPAIPYGHEDLQPLSSIHPADSIPIPPASPSSSSSWGLPRNIPMPWQMQFPAGWQFPNVPTMPQFVRRRSVEGEDGDKTQQKEKEMFDWMWMQYLRNQWNLLQQQQQGAQQAPDSQEKRGSPNTHTAPATPTIVDEPPSPLSLDPPSKLSVPSSSSTKIYP
ncbi:15300_t:CDS:2, partial [Acaulospora colombiana]